MKMLRILIIGCLFVISSSRNVPANAPPVYSYEGSRFIGNNPYFSNDYAGQDYTYKGDIDPDPENYEINVDHQKYIPTIEGRPIYIPPILKYDGKRISPKQYSQDTRPWHYWQNAQIPKYGHIDEKRNENLMRRISALPPYKVRLNNAKDSNYEYELPNNYEIGNEDSNVLPGFYQENMGSNRRQYGLNEVYENRDVDAEYFPKQNPNYNRPNLQLTQNEYDISYNDKVGDVLPSPKTINKVEKVYENKLYHLHDTNTIVRANESYVQKSNILNKTPKHSKGNKTVLTNVHSSTRTYGTDSERTSKINTTQSLYQRSTQSSLINHGGSQDINYTNIQERNKPCKECEKDLDLEDSVDLEQKAAEKEFLNTIDTKFRSLIFNPSAKSTDKFQSCVTPKNESGHCRYVQHCLLPNIIGAIGQFMNYVCVIKDRFIGVCCAEHPISVIKVKWDDVESNETENSSISTPEECGISSRMRIVGGEKANPKDYPWMAALLTMSAGQFYCGGSLINSRYVLTAAHCTFGIPRDQILVRLGEYDFSDTEGSLGEDIPVIEIKRHGQYSRRTLENDIALLKLSRPANFSNHVKTICLPENKTFEGANATLAGWGNINGGGPSSDVLLEATFPIVDNKKCSDTHGLPVSKNAICTLSTPHDKGACNGDSGGPLMLLDDEIKRWYVVGVVSWGRRGCDPKFPTVYAGVSNYLEWIQKHAV